MSAVKRFGLLIFAGIILFVAHSIVKRQVWFSSFDAYQLLSKYDETEIEHFSNFAFQGGYILKWRSNPVLKFQKRSELYYLRDSIVYDLVRSCIRNTNKLLGTIHISVETTDVNVALSLKDSISYSVRGQAPTYVSGLLIPYPTVVEGEVDIVVADRSLDEINSTIHHEIAHLLGFHHNIELYQESDWTYKSLFNPPTSTFIDSLDRLVEDFTEYSDLDKAAIRIMYDKDVAIDPGLTRQKFDRLIEEAKKKMK